MESAGPKVINANTEMEGMFPVGNFLVQRNWEYDCWFRTRRQAGR
jgi:hypothetical protein